ncbi:MAG: DUF4175 family protein [Alphaproteobacteria bacterium]|nr:DUF4175 family protein [Alphaproteobacteria bacterium]
MAWQLKIPAVLRHGRTARPLAAIIVGLAALIGWGVAGSQIITALNPTLVHEILAATRPALDVWITPPEYAGGGPLIISTPAGVRFDRETLTVPAGSIVSAHLAEQDGDAPELMIDDNAVAFTPDAHGDFAATEKLTEGKHLVIRRGWLKLASWRIHIVEDTPPVASLTAPPVITDAKNIRVAYTASDNLNVAEVDLRVTPHDALPGANNAPVDIPLTTERAKNISRVDIQDLTARPWAGQQVALQIVATNVSGKKGISDPVDFTLPERSFFHPVARVLIEERKRLMEHPDDTDVRDETANIMAGIAHEVGDYKGDPVVLMALRSGAVRLILDRGHEAAVSAGDLLWDAATRIENGNSTESQQHLRDAQRDLAEAIDHNASKAEIQRLTERLQKAMAAYMNQLSLRTAQRRITTAHDE